MGKERHYKEGSSTQLTEPRESRNNGIHRTLLFSKNCNDNFFPLPKFKYALIDL